MYLNNYDNYTRSCDLMARWSKVSRAEDCRFESRWAHVIFILYFSLASGSPQLGKAQINEVKHDIAEVICVVDLKITLNKNGGVKIGAH